MKIGNTTSMFFGFGGSKEGFAKMKRFGFDCADYQGLLTPEDPIYSMSEHDFGHFLRGEKQNADDAGIIISQVHGPWPTDDTTPESRKSAFECFRRSIIGTSYLGCRYVVIHPHMPYGRSDTGNEASSWEMNLDFFSRLAPIAKENGVVICIENMPMMKLSMATWDMTEKLVDELGDPDTFAICLDTGHCAVRSADPAEVLAILGDKVKVIHVHDNNGQRDLHQLPFMGVIDWRRFAREVRKHDLVLSLEPSPRYIYPPELEDVTELMLISQQKIAKALATVIN